MAEQHPIQGIMYTAMQSLKEMIDVNTIVGDAVKTPDGTVIIPISKVGLGFGVGGSEFGGNKKPGESDNSMFGGGSGGGISINPVAFLVVGGGQIRLMPVCPETTIYDRVLDMIPTAIDKISDSIEKRKNKKNSEEKPVENADDLNNSSELEASTPSPQVNVGDVEPPVFTDMNNE